MNSDASRRRRMHAPVEVCSGTWGVLAQAFFFVRIKKKKILLGVTASEFIVCMHLLLLLVVVDVM